MGSILRPGRFKRDPREMDEDEEMWFNDDEFDNDGGANGSNGDTASPEDDDTAASVPTSSAAAAAVAPLAENQVRVFQSYFFIFVSGKVLSLISLTEPLI